MSDTAGVAAGAGDQHRRERGEERKPREVEARRRLGDAAVLGGEAVFAQFEGEADPAEVGAEPRAPDDVPHVENAATVEHGKAAFGADRPLEDALDARACEVLL